MQRVLVLGAGLVVRPLVEYLLEQGYGVTVATRTVSKAEALVGDHPNGVALSLLIDDVDMVTKLVAEHDLTISLVPPPYHPQIAQICLDCGKNLVTTSYLGEPMLAFDGPAKEKGLLFLNEIGLDPGIDHMASMQIIDRVHAEGGKVVTFNSNCGALPAPEAANNPWGYKFSWSPIGVVRAVRNNARFMRGGEIVDWPSEKLFEDNGLEEIPGVGTLEVYPNRDSLGYIEMYGIPEVKDMFRGTMRFPSHCDSWTKIVALGLPLEDEEFELAGLTLKEAFARVIKMDAEGLREALMARFDIGADHPLFARLDYIRLLSDEPCPLEKGTPLELLVHQLDKHLFFGEMERDMVALKDTLIVEFPDGRKERHISLLVDYGIPGGDSATARTVSLPAAIATRMILDGSITAKGVYGPTIPEIYGPVLKGLEEVNIVLDESVEVID